MKEQETGQIILKGVPTQEGMFKVSKQRADGSMDLAFIAEKEADHSIQSKHSVSSRNLWHCRLGHPNDKVLSQVFSDCNLWQLVQWPKSLKRKRVRSNT